MSANDDQRMRELIDRLMAMSPEPPPFPEEVTVTNANPGPKRSPLLMFAGAAALVLIIALIPILLSGGDNNTANSTIPGAIDTTTTTTGADTTVPDSTTVPEATTTTQERTTVQDYEAAIYLLQDPANSNLGNPALVAFATTIVAEAGLEFDNPTLAKARLDLLTNPELQMPSERFWNGIPEGVQVVAVDRSADGDTFVIDMNQAFLEGAGGLLADVTMLNQLVYTAAPPWIGIDGVLFTVNDQPIDAYGTEGIDLTEPVTLTTFEGELNPIIVTGPVIYNGDEVPRVVGRANVFEAAVSLQIVESESGDVVYEDNTTATSGTGTWGDYAFDLDTTALTADRLILVFSYSAKDGTPTDVVTIPVSNDGTWDLLPDQG